MATISSTIPIAGSVDPLSMTYQTQNSSGLSESNSNARSSGSERLPDWYLRAGQGSSNYFTDFLNNGLPTGGYEGDRVAGLDPNQNLGIGQAGNYINSSSPLYQQGINMMGASDQLMRDSSVWNESEMMRHLNPYLTGALGTVSQLANQNLMENVMPEVNSTFTGAGHFGSTRNGDFLNRAMRDNQQTISNTQANMINSAYGQASDDYHRWGQQGSQVGQQIGALGQQIGQYGITGLNTGMNLGGLNQTQQQKELEAQQAAWMDQFKTPIDLYNSLSTGFNSSVGRLTNQGENSSTSRTNSTSTNQSGGSSYSF